MKKVKTYHLILFIVITACLELEENSAPKVTTHEIINITDSTAECGGSISSDGGSDIKAKGVCWDTISNPTLENTFTNEGEGKNPFASYLKNLKPKTTYYVRAYATNTLETGYGDVVHFTTLGSKPKITISSTIDFSYYFAKCKSTLLSDGGFPIKQMGICWNTKGEPTLADSVILTSLSDNNFESEIVNLESNTTYYIRSFATNDLGTSYSSTISFTTKSPGVLVDIDGNTYRTIEVNGQTWTMDNLRVKHYVNGDSIPLVEDDSDWKKVKSGAICYYNNAISYVDSYGILYNFYSIEDTRGLCPAGWHVPIDSEWNNLIDFLGGENLAGGKMKCTKTEPQTEPKWNLPNTDATNESGFSGLPGGYRDYVGNFQYINQWGFWWYGNEKNPAQGTYQILRYDIGTSYNASTLKSYGMSVRCVKD